MDGLTLHHVKSQLHLVRRELVTVAEDTPEETPATKQARALPNWLSGCF
jgi:hypothetical protein